MFVTVRVAIPAVVGAEYFRFRGETLSTVGLGAVISQATDSGDFHVLLAATGFGSGQDFDRFIHLLIDAGIQQAWVNLHYNVRRNSLAFEAVTFRGVPPENRQTQPIPAANVKIRRPGAFPALYLPTIVANSFSAARPATISVMSAA